MAKIEGFKIKNFKALKDVTLGRLWNQQQAAPLKPLTVVIGKTALARVHCSMLSDSFQIL